MGTFDGSDENALPSVLRDYAVLVSTDRVSVPENPDVFHIHTSPEWQTSGASHQWLVIIPFSPTSGKVPAGLWMHRNNETSEETVFCAA